MLKTAFKPKWIATLVGCLLAASLFVLLSQWQFGQSTTTTEPISQEQTENAVPLTEHFQPGRDMYVPDADQIVSATGEFVKDSAVIVNTRLQDGVEGYWVVAAFRPDGAPDGNVIPVVRGWQKDFTQPAALPTGKISIEGRLLPSESPTLQPSDVSAKGYTDLSAAQLANVWNLDAYDGFIALFDATAADGTDVGAASAGLEEVWVGPQPEETSVNLLNIFYGVEWIVFAGFAFFVWWRLVKDDYVRETEYQAELSAWKQRQALRDAAASRELEPSPASSGIEEPTPSGKEPHA